MSRASSKQRVLFASWRDFASLRETNSEKLHIPAQAKARAEL
jgi:hypothetical protein